MTAQKTEEVKKIEAIGRSLGWREVELQHALLNLDNDYGQECITPLKNGREMRCPAYPAECDYVRVTQNGFELAYWTSDEWAEDPQTVMGAFMGAAHGG